jgi:cytochrome c oxidase assembly protein subunit 15
LRVIHPVLAVVAASVGWWFSGRVGTPRSNAGKTLPALVGLMLLTGVLNVALGVPVWMQLVHLLLADLLWITYVLASAHAIQVPAVAGQRV